MRNGPVGLARGTGPHLPTILFHGDGDHTVNPANANALEAQALAGQEGLRTAIEDGRSAGGLTWRRTCHRDANDRAVLERWTVYGAGHAWCGGRPDGSFTEPRGPDASREMLRFFLSTTGTRG